MKASVFGMPIQYKKWNKQNLLPLYISECYGFKLATIANKHCLIISPKEELGTLPALKKQIAKIKQIACVPVVLSVESISNYRRQSLLENNIAFITKKQVYLPFIGTILEDEKETEKGFEKFMFSTQQLFLFYIYANEERLYIANAVKKLPFTAMTLSRATKQLEASGLFEVSKDGVNKVIESKYAKKELFEKGRAFLSSPVKAKGYINSSNKTKDMVFAGVSALSKHSMIGEPRVATYGALEKGFNKDQLINELIDPSKQIEIELWAYNPKQFSSDNCADILSVALSLQNTLDERIESAIEKLLEERLG